MGLKRKGKGGELVSTRNHAAHKWKFDLHRMQPMSCIIVKLSIAMCRVLYTGGYNVLNVVVAIEL
jgi:hypothetical protein